MAHRDAPLFHDKHWRLWLEHVVGCTDAREPLRGLTARLTGEWGMEHAVLASPLRRQRVCDSLGPAWLIVENESPICSYKELPEQNISHHLEGEAQDQHLTHLNTTKNFEAGTVSLARLSNTIIHHGQQQPRHLARQARGAM